ncbi:YggT family protein [Candidatus Njordibacter sp. Uisw_056]|jgi:YggT family protein|uniref:YggT family protein n=1 Tax=Candidatus Njordibacter sp. Uisw_056 TaxID=3230973 RepID=UPI003D4E763E|tara:strand:- start:7412 stop:7993 length:582 start_codon:yes stop_codon:yes gene_type:complete
MSNAGVFLVQTVFGLYLTLVIIRFMLQLAKADFYNPLAQAVVKMTQPFVTILQKVMPRTGRFSLATLVLAFLVQLLLIVVVLLIAGFDLPNPMSLAVWSLIGLASQVLDLLFFAILASIVLSWLAPQTNHPGAYLLHQLTEPVMSPVRRMLPNLGGLDFSPILVFIMINLVDMLVIQNAASTFGMPRGLVLGL